MQNMKSVLPYIVLASAIALLDFMTGRTMTLWVLQLLPIALGAWNLGKASGYSLAVICAAFQIAMWFIDPLVSDSMAGLTIWGSRLMVFFLAVALMSALRTKEVPRVVHPSSHSG